MVVYLGIGVVYTMVVTVKILIGVITVVYFFKVIYSCDL